MFFSGDNTVTTTFQITPKTPTYLLAFIVSNFESRTATTTGTQIPQKIYARSNAVHGAPFGLQAGVNILTAFENYFNIKFSLPKMDQAAIPDFSAGAMENWGLVTYRYAKQKLYILFY